jgi:hypothetical protein
MGTFLFFIAEKQKRLHFPERSPDTDREGVKNHRADGDDR